MKSFKLAVQLSPPWQLEQLAEMKSERPARISAAEAALGKPATGAFGVRTALRTHSRKAVKAGTLLALPGKVTVTCGRFALGTVKALTMPGATFRSPVSPMSRP